mgnify:CR=1 FL=1
MNQTNTVSAPRTKTYEITMTALMAAVTCILAPLSIPIGPVPISFTNLAIYLSLYLLGWKKGTISYLIYLLLGLVGSCKAGRSYRRIHHRLYRYGCYCRTGN